MGDEDGRLQRQTRQQRHVRAHRVHGLQELVDKPDLIGIFDAVSPFIVEIVDRRINHTQDGQMLQAVEEPLHQQRTHDHRPRPSLSS